MEVDYRTYLRHYPDRNGRFGPYGGAYLTEGGLCSLRSQTHTRPSATPPSSSVSCAASARSSREDPHRSITASAFQELSATVRFI